MENTQNTLIDFIKSMKNSIQQNQTDSDSRVDKLVEIVKLQQHLLKDTANAWNPEIVEKVEKLDSIIKTL